MLQFVHFFDCSLLIDIMAAIILTLMGLHHVL